MPSCDCVGHFNATFWRGWLRSRGYQGIDPLSVQRHSESALCMRAGGKRGGKKRIGLSLHVARVNAGMSAEALAPGLQLAAAVRSVEDHGYILSLGIKACTLHASLLFDLARPACNSGHSLCLFVDKAAIGGHERIAQICMQLDHTVPSHHNVMCCLDGAWCANNKS